MDAVLWLARAASPWRDLPSESGHWKSVYTRLRRWSQTGVCEEIDVRVQAFVNRPLEGDWPFLWLDATYVKLREGGRAASVARTMYGWRPRGKGVFVDAGTWSVAAMYTASELQHGGCAP